MTDADQILALLAQLRILLDPTPDGEDAVQVEDWSEWTDDERDGYFLLKQELTLETVHVSEAERCERMVAALRRLLQVGEGGASHGWASRWTPAQWEAWLALRKHASDF